MRIQAQWVWLGLRVNWGTWGWVLAPWSRAFFLMVELSCICLDLWPLSRIFTLQGHSAPIRFACVPQSLRSLIIDICELWGRGWFTDLVFFFLFYPLSYIFNNPLSDVVKVLICHPWVVVAGIPINWWLDLPDTSVLIVEASGMYSRLSGDLHFNTCERTQTGVNAVTRWMNIRAEYWCSHIFISDFPLFNTVLPKSELTLTEFWYFQGYWNFLNESDTR